MSNAEESYEWIRNTIGAISRSTEPSNRSLAWVADEHILALARDSQGRIEVFVTGPPVTAADRTVSAVLEHQVWTSKEGEMPANRIVLPTGDHFDQFAALLSVELLNAGVLTDAQQAFSDVEPLIAIALRRERLADETLTGLIGELELLEGLIRSAAPGSVSGLIDAWAGSKPSARDFQLGTLGVEVKTTQGPTSKHHVSGVHQVEVGHGNDGVVETDLLLVSLGLSFGLPSGQGRALPELVDTILSLLPSLEVRDGFLAKVQEYGGDNALGYNHERDRTVARFAVRYYFRFERAYDMADDRLSVLTSQDLAVRTHVDAGSVTFRVDLPERLRGGVVNPVQNWDRIIPAVVEKAGASIF